jgi:hypothetical protein
MQFLMVLLVMIGVIVLMLAGLAGISYGVGAFMNSRDGSGADPSDTDPCAQCRADLNWYEDLPIWKRNLVTVWWLANRYRCSEKGCD